MCDRCEELEEELQQVKADMFGTRWLPPAELKLTASQSAILQTLVRHVRPVGRWALFEATRYSGRSNKGDTTLKIVDVQVSLMRTKLKPFGIAIKTHWDFGYEIPQASRMRLLNWPTPHQQAA